MDLDFDFLLVEINQKLYKIYPDPISISSYVPPYEIEGVPVLEDRQGNKYVILAHLLKRVLVCGCDIKNKHGLFKSNKRKHHRKTLNISCLFRGQWKNKGYPLCHIGTDAPVITMEGVKWWIDSGEMKKFVTKEYGKCIRKGCLL